MLRPAPLVNAAGEQCHVPLEHRKLLSDIAAWLIFTDKNDARALVTKETAMQGLRALAKDHRDREGQFTRQIGRIYPRQQRVRRRYVVAGY